MSIHSRSHTANVVALLFWVGALSCNGFVLAGPQNQQQLAEAERAQSQVIQLFGAGKYQEALPFAKQVLRIWETELGPLHPDVAAAMGNLGEIHRQLGDYAAAKPLHERSLKIRERIHGQNHTDTALSATYLAMVYEALGDYAAAEKRYQQALKIREQVFAADHPEVASALNNIGNLLKRQSKLSEAEALFLRGLAIRRKTQGPQHIDNAPSLDSLASVYKDQGRFAEAEPLYKQALQIREKQLGKEHPDTALTLNNLAMLYEAQSRYAEARPLQQRALAIREKLLGFDHQLTAVTASNLGSIQEALGEFAAAEKLYLRALKSLEKTAGPSHFETGIVVNNLASNYKKQNRLADSEQLYQRALTIFEQQLGPEHRHTAQVLSNLGGLREQQGDFPTAERHYRRSVDIRRKVLGIDHPDTAQSINNLALLLAADHRIADAIPMLKQSLAVRQQTLGADHPTTVDALGNLASYQEQQHDSESIDNFDLARRGVRRYVTRELPALSEQQQSLFLKANYERGLYLALSCGLLHADKPDVVQKSASWLLNGKAVGVEALAQQTVARRTDTSKTTPPVWVELDELRAAIPQGAVFVDVARIQRFDFEIKPGAATWLSPHYAAWVTPATGAGEVQLVDLGPADDIDALVKQVREQLLKAHGEEGEIAVSSEQEAVIRLNDALQSLANLVWKPLAPHLGDSRELLLSPDGDLWLLPWAALPVGQNEAAGDATSLVEDYSLRLIVSGRDLTRKNVAAVSGPPVILANPEFDQPAGRKKQSIIGIFKKVPPADEDSLRAFSFKSRQLKALPLPNTEIEAISIEPQIETYAGRGVRVFKQRYALESVVKALKGPKVAVFATHGFFMPKQQAELKSGFSDREETSESIVMDLSGKPFENPLLRCGLLLSGCNQKGVIVGADDGILTGSEVTRLNLRGTKLVVLSACETGLGDINQGEGVAGLRQAFHLAGAESVVASLWKVSDRETSLLIRDFFRNLAAGQSKSDALQNAQLERIRVRRNRYGAAHPFYWAAFTLTGQ